MTLFDTKIISISNQKGGVGKTTSSINIASYLAASEIPTLIIDMDPQSNSTSGLGVELAKDICSIYDVIIKEVHIKDAILNTKLDYLDIVPASSQLVGAEIELVSEISREYRLKEALDSIRGKYKYVIIDSPPSITFETIQIVKVANGLFVPVQPSPLDLKATVPFLNLVRKERKKATVILNRVMPRAKLTDAMIMRLRYAGAKIARSRISGKIIYAETFSVGRGVVDISITSEASKEIIKVGNEILRNF